MINGKFLGFFLLLLLIGIFFVQRNTTLQGRLQEWGIRMDLPGFQMTNFSTEKTKAVQEENLEARKGEVIVRLTKSTVENNKKLIDDRVYLLESLFVPTTSPYPEVLSNNITCPEEFRPREEKVENGSVFTLFAGERFNFGICSQDLVKYKAVYGIFDCGDKGVFEVKLFGQNLSEMKTTAASFSCE